MTMFKSDVQSVRLSRGYSYADTLYTLIKVEPFTKQSFFQMVDVMDPATVHSLLQNVLDRVVNRIEIQAVWWPVLRPVKSGVSADSSATVLRAR